MNIIERIVFRNNYLFNRKKYNYLSLSFAQEGEDKILDDYFNYKNRGFYIEVGAHHPQRFSNTYLFYLKGWNGINIDALPSSMKQFKKLRPRDINLETGISNQSGEVPFYIFQESALNTFDVNVAEERLSKNTSSLLSKTAVRLEKLSVILDHYLLDGIDIDFLSIDVEGYDLNVLLSNNWQKYRPKVVIVEDIKSFGDTSTPIAEFMESVGYVFFARTNRNSFFKNVK